MTTEIVTEIDIVKYVAARKTELDLLKQEAFLGKENVNKSLFQTLPRHMRRRTMGYLRKRLPHRIRKLAVIKPPSKVSKRPSRKYRRRPVNLVKDYERRKHGIDGKMWLETHIWHAKRFKMSESLYGYKLALNFNCKCRRAVLKCLKEHCCIHDESYYVCIQLDASCEQDLIDGLNKLCSPEIGLTFAAKIYLNGKCEGKTIFYEQNKYPFNCIGPVRFHWLAEQGNNKKSIWIWSHPSIHSQIEAELINVFKLSKQNESISSDSPQTKRMKLNEENLDYYESFDDRKIVLKSLKDKLNRFKLLGPMSTNILANLLQTIESSSSETEFYQKQALLWNNLKTSLKHPNDLIQSTVIGLLVKDPRYLMPKKKSFNKIKQQNLKLNCFSSNNNSLLDAVKADLLKSTYSHSTIWIEQEILKLNQSRQTTQEINKLRSNLFIPGTELTANIENVSKIPILLVQNSLNNIYAGWDLIVPKEWGMPFWLPLIHMGARAIGQTELNYLHFESGILNFPVEGYPDTKSGQMEANKIRDELFRKYLSRPPSKRVNYLKHGILTPFSGPFQTILKLNQTNKSDDESFFLLRNRYLINKLSSLLFKKNKQLKLNEIFSPKELETINKSFMCVRLVGQGKGKIEKFSLIYNYSKSAVMKQSQEEKQVVCKLINNLRRERIKTETANKDVKKATLNKLLKLKFNKNELLVDEKAFESFESDLVNAKQEHRLPIGFVSESNFTLINGKYSANAYISANSLLDIIQLKHFNTMTLLQYRAPSSYNFYKTAKIMNLFT